MEVGKKRHIKSQTATGQEVDKLVDSSTEGCEKGKLMKICFSVLLF